MNEEVKPDEKVDDLAPGEGEVTPTQAEQRAMNDGWRPRTEWEGDEDEWVDAKSFNFRGELMGRISQQGRKLATLEGENAQLSTMVRKGNEATSQMVEAAYKKALRQAKAELRDARREGDGEREDQLEEQIDELKDAHKDLGDAPAQQPQQPDLAAMTPQQRAWFDLVQTTPELNQDPVLFQKALKYADQLLNENPNMPVGQFIGGIGQHLAAGSKRQAAPGPDDGGGGRQRVAKGAGKYRKADLDEMEMDMAKVFIDDGTVKSYDEYATLLGKDGNLTKQSR